MQNERRKKIIIISLAIVVIALIIGAVFLFKTPAEAPDEETIAGKTPGVKEEGQLTNKEKTPDIKDGTTLSYTGRPLNEIRLMEGFNPSQEVINFQRERLSEFIQEIQKNPDNVDAWVGIGVVKKFFNDYEGAKDVWSYTTFLFPNHPITFSNLASLYGFYLGDKDKAIFNYEHLINISPWEPSYYLSFGEFYRDVEKNGEKVIEVIMVGMENAPQDVNLPLFLASYYKSVGDGENAIKYYERVLELSPGHRGVQDEINSLMTTD